MRKHFAKIFSFMRPCRVAYAVGIFFYSAQGFMSSFISSVFSNRMTEAVMTSSLEGILQSILLFLGMQLIFFVAAASGVLLYVGSEIKAVRLLKRALFRRFVQTGLEASMETHSGEGIAALNTEADSAAELYGGVLSPLLGCVINIVFSLAVVLGIDWRLGLMSTVTGLAAALIQGRFAKGLGRIGEETLTANTGATKAVSNLFSGALAIRAFNAQERALLRYDRENGKLKVLSFHKAFLAGWQNLFTTVQGWLTVTGVFALGGYLVVTGRLSFPMLMMVPPLCEVIALNISDIGGAWANMQAPLAAAKRVCERLGEGANEQPTRAAQRDAVERDDRSALTDPVGLALTARNLHFAYASAEKEALRGVDLDIRPNEMVAIVGESGSGKSTLLKLLGGFYERDGLDIKLGGAAFDRENLPGWRRLFAYVDQSCKLFDMSIRENIALGAIPRSEKKCTFRSTGDCSEPKTSNGAQEDVFGSEYTRPYAEVSAAEIKAAARAAHADTFIAALPENYNASCGEKGAALSGGQKQRIAIARALIRRAPVIIFDEATSALDAETERNIMRTIYGLRGRHTILITTHNLNNITGADRIVVMDKGRVAEMGRHEELLQAGGLYARLYMR